MMLNKVATYISLASTTVTDFSFSGRDTRSLTSGPDMGADKPVFHARGQFYLAGKGIETLFLQAEKVGVVQPTGLLALKDVTSRKVLTRSYWKKCPTSLETPELFPGGAVAVTPVCTACHPLPCRETEALQVPYKTSPLSDRRFRHFSPPPPHAYSLCPISQVPTYRTSRTAAHPPVFQRH